MRMRNVKQNKVRKMFAGRSRSRKRKAYAKARRDFAQSKRRKNPHVHREREADWKLRIKLAVIVGSFVTTLGLAFYHPFFSVSEITVEGLQRIEEKELRQVVDGALDYRFLFVIPARDYFVLNVDTIRDILLERYPIQSIVVKKSFPNYLSIVIEEKISTVIYDDGVSYSFIGLDGKIVEVGQKVGEHEWQVITQSVTSTSDMGEEVEIEQEVERIHIPDVSGIKEIMGDFPLVYHTNPATNTSDGVVLGSKLVNGIVDWYEVISRESDIPVTYYEIQNELGTARIHTSEGWDIKVRIDGNVQQQFRQLEAVLEKKIKRPYLQYVDLRYAGRVYWR